MVESGNDHTFLEMKRAVPAAAEQLLQHCIESCLQRVCFTGSPLLYIDGFAGKGRLDNGEDGSALIALKTMRTYCPKTGGNHPLIRTHFIEARHAAELQTNLAGYACAEVIPGTCEEKLPSLLQQKENWNVLFYADPPGIGTFQHHLLLDIAAYCFASVEILVNLDTLAFLHAGCTLLEGEQGAAMQDDPEAQDGLSRQHLSEDLLSRAAGGDYWSAIVRDYHHGRLDVRQAEQLLADGYVHRLRSSYRYVLDIPVRSGQEDIPRRRMLHVTNHPDACLGLYRAVCRKTDGEDITPALMEDAAGDAQKLRNALEAHVQSYAAPTRLNEVMADFLSAHGVICPPHRLRAALQSLEEDGAIRVLHCQDLAPEDRWGPRVEANGDRTWIRRRE